MYDRALEQKKVTEIKTIQLSHHLKQREEREMTFKPRICEKSRKLTDVRHRSPVP